MDELTIKIGGEEVVCNSDFSIEKHILETDSVILNNCYPKSWETSKDYVSNFYYPQNYSICTIELGTTLLFAGVVKNSGTINLNPREPKYANIEVLDFKTLLSEAETLDYVLNNISIEDAIIQVIAKISSYGFKVGNISLVNGSDIIKAYSLLDKTPYDLFQFISDITGCRWFTRMEDENNLFIDFYDKESLPTEPNIDYTTQYFEENDIVDMTFDFSTSDYRNKQIITSSDVYGGLNSTQDIYADGHSTEYYVAEKIADMISIKVNNVSQTFATNEEKSFGIVANWYYDIGGNILTQNEDDSTLILDDLLQIEYTPLIKGREVAINSNEVSRISNQTNRKGIISRYENRNDITSSSELKSIAETYIKYRGKGEISVKITTQNNDLLEIGHQVYFNIPTFEALQDNYLVKNKTIQRIQNGSYSNIFYSYELVNTFDMQNEVNFFDNQRYKNYGNLGIGEEIDRNIDIVYNYNIVFQNLSITEITPAGDNTLNSVLNSPFID